MMVIADEPTEDLVREMYAHFGLAYYHSEVLHRGLCIILAMIDLPRRDMITRPRVEEHLANAFSLTFGQVITELADMIPAEFSTRLEEVREKRNFLVWDGRVLRTPNLTGSSIQPSSRTCQRTSHHGPKTPDRGSMNSA
jgi:hypothetical protein